jgi:adenylate/nucleoside-diphosphate kinase
MDDPSDFDRRVHEIAMTKHIFEGMKQSIINGNFFDIEEEAVSTPLNELLVEAKKLPELVLHLKVDEKNFMQRKFDEKEVKSQYETLVE